MSRAPDDRLTRLLPEPLRRERETWYTPDRTVRNIHWVRFVLVLVALVDATAHISASPAKSPEVTLWLDGEVILYVLIAMVNLLGLRMWYLPALAYSALNLMLFVESGFVAIPGITTVALTGHLAFSHYFFGRGVNTPVPGRRNDAEGRQGLQVERTAPGLLRPPRGLGVQVPGSQEVDQHPIDRFGCLQLEPMPRAEQSLVMPGGGDVLGGAGHLGFDEEAAPLLQMPSVGTVTAGKDDGGRSSHSGG